MPLALTLILCAERCAAQPPNGGVGSALADARGHAAAVELFEEQRPDQVAAEAHRRPVRGGHRAGLRRRPRVALGTVVAADGLIVTKASQLTAKLECQLADGRKLPATVVGQDEATDLALLHVDAKNLTPDRVGRRARRAGEPRGGHRSR